MLCSNSFVITGWDLVDWDVPTLISNRDSFVFCATPVPALRFTEPSVSCLLRTFPLAVKGPECEAVGHFCLACLCVSEELYLHFPTHYLDVLLVKQWDKCCLVQLWASDTSLWCNFIDYLHAWLQIACNWFLSICAQFYVFPYILVCCQCIIIHTLSTNKKRIYPCAHLKACGGE